VSDVLFEECHCAVDSVDYGGGVCGFGVVVEAVRAVFDCDEAEIDFCFGEDDNKSFVGSGLVSDTQS